MCKPECLRCFVHQAKQPASLTATAILPQDSTATIARGVAWNSGLPSRFRFAERLEGNLMLALKPFILRTQSSAGA